MKLREMSLFFKIPPWVFGAYLISSFLVSRMSILFLALVMLASPAKTLSSSDILSSCSIYKIRNYYPKENDIRKYCNVSTPAVLIPAMLFKYDSDCYTVYKSILNSLLIPCRIYDKLKALGSTSILHVLGKCLQAPDVRRGIGQMTDGCMNGLVWFVSARKFCEFSILPISLHILHKSLFLESIL